MDFLDRRIFRIELSLDSQEATATRIRDLQHMLISALEDLVVLQELMHRKGLWDEALYQELRTEAMVAQHSGQGGSPWQRTAQYRYTLDEDEFLRKRLSADDARVAAFHARADSEADMT